MSRNFCAMLAAVGVLASFGTPPRADDAAPLPADAIFHLINGGAPHVPTNFCLDAHSPDIQKNGCRVQLWQKLDIKHQRWQFVKAEGEYVWIVNAASRLVLDAHAPDVGMNGCQVQLWERKQGEKQQHWGLTRAGGTNKEPIYRITNRASGKVLDAHSTDAGKNGCRIQLWDYKSESQQFWLVKR